MRKFCKKAKGTRGTANSASSGTLRSWHRASSYHCTLEKSRFLQKTRFFHKTFLWLSRGRRPLRVPLMMPLSMRALSKRIYFCILLKPAFVQISYKNSLRRDPRTSFFALFSEGLSDPRSYRSPMYRCSEVFFATLKTCVQKIF